MRRPVRTYGAALSSSDYGVLARTLTLSLTLSLILSRLECPLCCKSFCLVCRTSPWHTGVRCETWQAGPEPEP